MPTHSTSAPTANEQTTSIDPKSLDGFKAHCIIDEGQIDADGVQKCRRTVDKVTTHDEFWKEYLANAQPTLLVGRRAQEVQESFQVIPGDLKAKANAIGVSVSGLIHAAWAIMLYHRTGSQDVLFGSTYFDKKLATQDLLRPSDRPCTLLPQRISISPVTTLKEFVLLVERIRKSVLSHSREGLGKTISAARPQDNIFDTIVSILDEDGLYEPESQGFRNQAHEVDKTSRFLTLHVQGSQLKLAGRMDSRRQKFVLESVCGTVQSLLENSSLTIETLQCMGHAEKRFLLDDLSNRDHLHIPEASLLHAGFVGWAQSFPHKVAIDWEGHTSYSYAELNRLTDVFAQDLVQKGISTGSMVPLIMDKSVEMIVAILGVLKAGAAYVPLSPESPPQRNALILVDIDAKVVITQPHLLPAVESFGLQQIHVDMTRLQLSSHAPALPVFSPESLAYVIFTSGSTGAPKGVQILHRQAAAAVVSMSQAEGRHQGVWRALQFANYVFDASVQDIFNTLSTGGTLCMSTTDELLSDLPFVMNSMQVKQAILTPSVARVLDPEDVPTLERLMLVGEPLPLDVITNWASKVDLINVYGPTETSMIVATKAVKAKGDLGIIGKPFPTVMAFMLHPEDDSLVPFGSEGELCIGGPQVGAGYLNRPQQTAAAFIDSTATQVDWLYRTGDIARWLPDGEIEFFGRKDNQIKIHGHRVEIGEIEHALMRIGIIHETAVSLVEVHSRPVLVAFCVIISSATHAKDEGSNIKSIKAGLTNLTSYMMPKYVILLDSLPKLPSRKVDRNALKKLVGKMDATSLQKCFL